MADMEKVAINEHATDGGHKRRSGFLQFNKKLFTEKPLGAFGAIIILILLFTGIFADAIAPYGVNETKLTDALLSPSHKYLLGTDNLGRDLLTRIIYGARISMVVGLTAAAISTITSTFLGIVSAYVGGKLDLFLQRVVDALSCFPGLILLVVVMSMVGSGLVNVILVMGIRNGIIGSRIVRSAAMNIREETYIDSAKSIGCRTSRILARHILPNIMAPIIILFTARVPMMILTESTLSYLGFGVPPPLPSWGGMLSGSGRTYMFMAPWMILWPGVALSIVVYGINMFGDAVRDILDPRLKGRAGRYGISKIRKLEKKKEVLSRDQ